MRSLAGLCLIATIGCGKVTADRPDGAPSDDANPDAAAGVTVSKVVASSSHSCALLSNGKLRCWGDNLFGGLGYGDLNIVGDTETPASVGDVPLNAVVADVAVGSYFTCVLLENGAVRCWGYSFGGVLGIPGSGDITNAGAAMDIDLGGIASAITAGGSHACAIIGNGALRCWGFGANGQLGYANDNNIGDNETPATAGNVEVGGVVTKVTACSSHTCAVLSNGGARCWGNNSVPGMLGYPNTQMNTQIGDNERPDSMPELTLGGPAAEIVCGIAEACARLTDGSLRCWGDNTFGQSGYGNTTTIGDNEAPANAGAVPLGGEAKQVVVGNTEACALLTDDTVRCWGFGNFGTLGYANTNNVGDNETPASIGPVNVGGPVAQISMHMGLHVCALMQNGDVRCWGRNDEGQLGQANTVSIGDNETPASVMPVAVLDP